MDPVQMTLAVLAFATVMFVWEKIPMALTSVIICLLLALSGVLDARSAFSGFINPNVILFVAMFVVGGALFETGMAGRLGGLVTRFARTERQMIVAIMMIVGLLSAVLSNTGTAAVMIPVVIGIAERTGFSRSRLLMPLAFASTMGGTLTLIGSPGNLIAQHFYDDKKCKNSCLKKINTEDKRKNIMLLANICEQKCFAEARKHPKSYAQ